MDPAVKARFDAEAEALFGKNKTEFFMSKESYDKIVSTLLVNESKTVDRDPTYYRLRKQYQIIHVKEEPTLIQRKQSENDPNVFVVHTEKLYETLRVNTFFKLL